MMRQTTFQEQLFGIITDCLANYYENNYDEERFGKKYASFMLRLKKRLSKLILPNHINKYYCSEVIQKTTQILLTYGKKLNDVYLLLADEESKEWLVMLIAYKILGHEKVKLPLNTSNERLSSNKFIFDYSKYVDVTFLGQKKRLFLADLSNLNMNIRVFSSGLEHIFVHHQYKYKNFIGANKGDVVLDCGACYGDTSLYFAHSVGETGKVFSFEFIPNHIYVFKQNLIYNLPYQNVIELIEKPVWHQKGKKVYFKDSGPGSRIAFKQFDGYEGTTTTETIDNFCLLQDVHTVNFIKMDIEGAEMNALRGSESTIRKNIPKLAIASYHSMDDFVDIPLWINNLGLGYKIYLGHSTIHWEESVVFASV